MKQSIEGEIRKLCAILVTVTSPELVGTCFAFTRLATYLAVAVVIKMTPFCNNNQRRRKCIFDDCAQFS